MTEMNSGPQQDPLYHLTRGLKASRAFQSAEAFIASNESS